MPRPTIVLVHGAWHGPWCWELVTPHLDAAGVVHGEVELPFTGHDDDIAATRSVLDGIEGPKILVGHSYGGLVISGAGDERSDLAHLVYLCAFMPPAGQTIFEATSGVGLARSPKIFDALRTHDDGTSSIDTGGAVAAFFECCPVEVAIEAVARLRPMDASSTTSPCRGAPWRTVSSTYVLCERDEAIPIEAQRHMATQATDTVTLDTDHSPFLSMPETTAQVLIEVVSRF